MKTLYVTILSILATFAAMAAEHENWVDEILAGVSEEEALAMCATLERLAGKGEAR